jgi:hypothetical protein
MKLPFKTVALFVFLAIPILIFFNLAPAHGGTEGMVSMPKIVEKKTRTVEANDAADSEKGFGAEAPMVRMMNLMMVEGSGMEGMKMKVASAGETAPASHTPRSDNATTSTSQSEYLVEAKSSVSPPKAGLTVITVKVLDKLTKKSISGLKLKAQVYMTSMDMGTEQPAITDLGGGAYQLKAPFAMKGPWAIKVIFPNKKEQIFNFDVQAPK